MLKIRDKYDYRREFADRLRKTDKKQGTGVLYNAANNEYCALGVFITEVLHWKIVGGIYYHDGEKTHTNYERISDMLDYHRVSVLNDTGWTYEEIATVLDKLL